MHRKGHRFYPMNIWEFLGYLPFHSNFICYLNFFEPLLEPYKDIILHSTLTIVLLIYKCFRPISYLSMTMSSIRSLSLVIMPRWGCLIYFWCICFDNALTLTLPLRYLKSSCIIPLPYRIERVMLEAVNNISKINNI